MATGLDARAAEVFMHALGLSAPDRAPYLDQACGRDVALRAEVDSLLAADSQLTHAQPAPPEHATMVGARIGRYRVVRLLGSGGMGTVYEAEQDNPRRAVALKVVQPGLVGRSGLERFRYESLVLARLHHPGIAQVYEAGEHTPPGLPPGTGAVPFFAMELIEGAQTLPEYCTANGLSLRRRLGLFAMVCDAVHHGHQKGVIHRDLKPGNILVDPSGQPKVIDFGIARTTDSDVAAATMLTGASQLIGTLRYMSPEQCAGDPGAIDTRSDVYSLGVVLYELLAGRPPYDLDDKSIYEAPRIIREQPPLRPSAADRSLRGDVETIILKALEKDRDRRYASAAGLAADIRRFLMSEPISARPPTTVYQLRMFARRHKGLVGGVAAAFLALSVGLALAVRQTIRANAALDRAERQTYAAEIAAADGAIRAEEGGIATARLQAAPARLRGWEWHYLASLADRSVRKWEFPHWGIWAIASPDGAHVLVFDEPGTCSVRDAATGEVQWRCANAGAFRRAFSPDGSMVAIKLPSALSVRDARTGAELGRIEVAIDAPAGARDLLGVSFHPDGARLAVTATDPRVRLVNWREQRILHEWVHEPTWINEAQFSPDGAAVAYFADGSLLVRDTESGRIIHSLRTGAEATDNNSRALVFSPDGAMLADARTRLIHLWDPRAGTLIRSLAGHTHQVLDLAFTPDGGTLVSVGADRTVRVWDLASGGPPATLLGHASTIETVGLCMKGTQIVTGSGDGTVRFWDAHAKPAGSVLDTGAPFTQTVSFAPSGDALLTVSGNIAKLWELPGQRERFSSSLGDPESSFGDPGAVSPDGAYLALGADGPRLRVLDAVSGAERWVVGGNRGGRVECLSYSPDGSRIAAMNSDGVLETRDASTGALMHARDTGASANDIRFSPDGGEIAATGPETRVRIFDARTGELRRSVEDLPAEVYSIAFSPDGGQMAAGLADGTVVIWDRRSWRRLAHLTGMQPNVWSVAYSPDGSRLAAGSKDRAIHLWDTSTWVELLTLRGHSATVMDLAWSRDGRLLASASFDGTARVWEAPAPAKSP